MIKGTFTRGRSYWVALTAAAATGGVLAPSPLLGIQGVESALIVGLVLSPFIAAMSASAAARQLFVDDGAVTHRAGSMHDSGVGGRDPSTTLRMMRGGGRGESIALHLRALVVFAVPTLILFANSFRIQQCEPAMGALYFAMGPLIGTLLAVAVGRLLGEWFKRPLAVPLAFMVPLVAYGVSVSRFYSSPGVFAFNHFAGWFPGTIYDEAQGFPDSYLTFRLVTVGWFIAATAARKLTRALLSESPIGQIAGHALLFGLVVAGAIGATVRGDQLGHHTSVNHIAKELGHKLVGEHCTAYVPRELPAASARRVLADCDFRVWQTAKELGVTPPDDVRAFFFRSSEEKQRLMGAGHTYIAKPWRSEVYLQLRDWPHPVLEHEIVHVVAAEIGQGPFRVSGPLDGWLPDPALIEGVAVAVTWESRDGLSPHQWAKTLMELERLPRLRDVWGLNFLKQPSRDAYTIAGSVMRFVADHYGPHAMRRTYLWGSVERATGASLEEIEKAWRESLSKVSLPDGAVERARAAFSRKSIFTAICPRTMARLSEELSQDLSADDAIRAAQTCDRMLAIRPGDPTARVHQVRALAQQGRLDDAEALVKKMRVDPSLPAPFQAFALTSLADELWRHSRRNEAQSLYDEVLTMPGDEDAKRNLEVKKLAITWGGTSERALFDLLVGDRGRSRHSGTQMYRTMQLHERQKPEGVPSLGAYLAGRQLFGAERFELTIPLLESARSEGLPTERLEREATRMLAIAYVAEGRWDAAEALFHAQLKDTHTDHAAVRDWLMRVNFARKAPGQNR